MQLGTGVDLVLLTQNQPSGEASCDGFAGLPILNPCLIIIQTDGSQEASATAGQLRTLLAAEISRLSPTARSVSVPCGGNGRVGGCHGLESPDCEKLLLVVSGGKLKFTDIDLAKRFLNGGRSHHVLPLVPRNARIEKVLPKSLRKQDVLSTDASLAAVVPPILALVGLTTIDRRIFISYRRNDSQILADQLFDRLTHDRFDVFLDRYSVDPGVDFQRRLTEQLAHKSMVLLLESPTILESKWTMFEINYARQYRLGLLALQLPKSPAVPALAADERISIKPKQLTGQGKRIKLKKEELNQIVQRVDAVHGAALLRRREYLRKVMRAALLKAGVTDQSFGVDGLLIASGPNQQYYIQLTTRPPELPDFHLIGRRVGAQSKGMVIGPADTLGAATVSSLNWLSRVSQIAYFDEGRIRDVSRRIQSGQI